MTDDERAAILRFLAPEDGAIVEALAREECKRCGVDPDSSYRGEGALAWHGMTDCARDTLAALRALAQGETAASESSSQEQVREKD